jgi:integrase
MGTRPRRAPALDEAQAHRLLEAARTSVLLVPVLLALSTGLRRGEIYGLRWEDVDLARGALAVRRTLAKTGAGKARVLALTAPKMAKSRRVVALPALAVEVLRRHKAEQAEAQLALGRHVPPDGLIMATLEGGPIDPDTVTKAMARLAKRAEVPPLHFHDLRHTHATLLLKAGVGVRVVAERLGHASPSMTLNVYGHVLAGQDADAAARFEAAVGGGDGPG